MIDKIGPGQSWEEAELKPEPIDICRIVLAVEDLARAIVFYTRVLGLPQLTNQGVPGDIWFECGNGIVIGLSVAESDASGRVAASKLLIRVDDLRSVGERILKSGARVEPPDLAGERLVAWDPDGNRLFLVEGRGVGPGMTSRTRIVGDQLMVLEEATVPGPPDDVWIALTDPALISAWLCGGPAYIEPAQDGRLLLTFPHIGQEHTTWECRILDFVPSARLRFRDELLGLEVAFDLTPLKDQRTIVRLSMAPVDLSIVGEDARSAANSLALNWRRILRSLMLLMEDERAE